LPSGVQFVCGAVELLLDAGLFFTDVADSCFDLLLVPVGITDEVEVAVFLCVEFFEVLGEFFADLGGGFFAVVGSFGCQPFYRCPVGWVDVHLGVVCLDGFFDFPDR
jgi:hypothetical protein